MWAPFTLGTGRGSLLITHPSAAADHVPAHFVLPAASSSSGAHQHRVSRSAILADLARELASETPNERVLYVRPDSTRYFPAPELITPSDAALFEMQAYSSSGKQQHVGTMSDELRQVDIKYVSSSSTLRSLVANLHLTNYRSFVFESIDAMCDMNADVVVEMLALMQTLPKLRFIAVSVTIEEQKARSTSMVSSFIDKRVDCTRTDKGWRLTQMYHSGEPMGGVAPITIRATENAVGAIVWTKDFELMSS